MFYIIILSNLTLERLEITFINMNEISFRNNIQLNISQFLIPNIFQIRKNIELFILCSINILSFLHVIS